MYKIGIITLFHNNINYGGSLQAYALVKYLNSCGFDSEQIRTNFISDNDKKLFQGGSGVKGTIKSLLKCIIYLTLKSQFKTRRERFREFERAVPHSLKVYDNDTIVDVCNAYDAFITGSDQVWNMNWYNSAYFLSFARNKPKIAYAASMPSPPTLQQKKVIERNIEDFDAISVRETSTVDIIEQIYGKKVEQVVDPTLLLSRQEWTGLFEEIKCSGPYVCCYFLSSGKNVKEKVELFAKNKNLEIVTFPHVGSINLKDCSFGDHRVFSASPAAFLSYINNANYIITDSFHAAVFSLLFRKKFVVFARSGGQDMNTRLVTLLSYFQANNRFILPDTKLSEIEKIIDGDIDYDETELNDVIARSKQFLQAALEKKVDNCYAN